MEAVEETAEEKDTSADLEREKCTWRPTNTQKELKVSHQEDK